MRSASLCIGIVEYIHPAYSSSSRRLKFATSDARAFANYLRSAFGEVHGRLYHRLLEDRKALFESAEFELHEIAKGGPLDLFILYLAGHGEQGDAHGGWFCLADATPSQRSLDSELLERLLNCVRAQSVLVVVDCCHSEAVVNGMRFFTSLDYSQARLFVASARKDQLAWEDERLQRSVLSDVFLRACSTSSPVQSTSGLVNVEHSLFPYLREQIPLLAAAQKQGAVQEPVSGGSARANVNLPVVESKSFGRTLTVTQTVHGRLRQILVKGGIALLLVILFSEMMMYHLVSDSDGRMLVRPGLPITHALMPVGLLKDTDTGMRVDQLSTSDHRGAAAIAHSRLWGFDSHLDPHGLKPWFTQILPLLRTDIGIRAAVLTGAGEAKPLPDDSPPPLDEALFLSVLRDQRPLDVTSNFYPESSSDTVGCVQGTTHQLDYPILMAPAGAYARDLKWRSLLARNNAAAGLSAVITEIQNTAYRVREGDNTDGALAELWQLAFSLAALKPFMPISEDLRKTLVDKLDTSCRIQAALALRIFGFDADGTRAESLLLNEMEALGGETPNTLPTAGQTEAAYGLSVMAAAHPLEGSTMTALADDLMRQDPDLERTTLPGSVLLAAARWQALPRSLIDHLFAELQTQSSGSNFGYLAALKILSRNLAFLPPELVQRFGVWLDDNAEHNRTFEEVHEAIGFLLSVDPSPRPRLVELISDRLSPETYFPVPAVNYRGEPIIYSTGDAAAVALGRALQFRALPEDIEERLVRFAIGRKDAIDHQIIIDGLARRWYLNSVEPSDIGRRVRDATEDSARRLLEVDVACSRLLGTSASSRTSAIAGLLAIWREEDEPEVRTAIAQIIARSQWPRFADMTMCSGG